MCRLMTGYERGFSLDKGRRGVTVDCGNFLLVVRKLTSMDVDGMEEDLFFVRFVGGYGSL